MVKSEVFSMKHQVVKTLKQSNLVFTHIFNNKNVRCNISKVCLIIINLNNIYILFIDKFKKY